jgi:hypothetical protein
MESGEGPGNFRGDPPGVAVVADSGQNRPTGKSSSMKKVLTVTAVVEVATGMALLIVPSLVGRLLFGEELTGIVIPVARVLGTALIALGVGCWPGSTALCGMLTYGALVTLYLAYLGLTGEWVGPLLWPVVALHGILTVLLARAWFQSRTPN